MGGKWEVRNRKHEVGVEDGLLPYKKAQEPITSRR